jgi:hypothetical protein
MVVLTLWPLCQGELAGRREGFIDVLFPVSSNARYGVGFPEAVARREARSLSIVHFDHNV